MDLLGKLFNKKIVSNILVAINIIPAIVFITLSAALGIEHISLSDWGIKYEPPTAAFIILSILIIEGGILVLGVMAKTIYLYFKNKRKDFVANFLIAISFIIYLSIGAIDESGQINGWPLLFVRLIMVIAVIISYVSFTNIQDYKYKEKKKK